ncbi:MAG: hypothetical protein V1722_04470 [Candidatus Micrarchaeota archaeon]
MTLELDAIIAIGIICALLFVAASGLSISANELKEKAATVKQMETALLKPNDQLCISRVVLNENNQLEKRCSRDFVN